ncbi:MAG: RNA polymerase sigma factor [Alphaproteobacteria bacterium]|nr:RNA polymerase sigma factor [Alphaproteobacteria bacterium]
MEMALDALNDISDDVLLVLYANGDRTAASALTLRLTPMVFSLASRVLNDPTEAEDVVQDAMLRLWKMAPDWRQGEAKVSTWLYRVTSNLCTDRLRKRKGIGLEQIAEPEDERPPMDSRLQTEDRAVALRRALAELPDRQRQAVILRHFEGLANPDIAEVLRVSVAAVESLIARGKRNLARLLAGQKAELGLEE